MPSCEKCEDREVIEKDGKLYECICSFLKRISQSMPLEVRKAEVKAEHLKTTLMKSTAISLSLYVTAARADMYAIIKALMIKNPDKYIRITSDAEIRDVFVGSMSKSSKSMDYQGEVLNNLADLMLPPHLMVVRLNELSYKNKAASGALEEALKYRYNRERPTWVMSDINSKFQRGSHAYSDSVWDMISTGYAHVSIPIILKPKSIETIDMKSSIERDNVAAPSFSGSFDPEPIQNMEMDEPEEVIEVEEDDDDNDGPLAGWGQGLSSKKKWGR